MCTGLLAQCPHENCDGAKAFFYQVQIRSADEPMTTFYKVCYAMLLYFVFSWEWDAEGGLMGGC